MTVQRSPLPRPALDALDAAVLDASQRQSLVAIRSLGRAGLRVGAFESHDHTPSFASRHTAVIATVPDPAEGAARYRLALDRLIELYAPRVLIPAHDGTVEILRVHRAALEEHTAVALAPEAAMAVAVDKKRTLAVAAELGLQVPRSAPVREAGDLLPAIGEIGLPAVLKPARSWVEGTDGSVRLAAELVCTVEEARAATARALAVGAELVLQEHVPGAREAIWLLLDHDGRVAARCAQVAHRMFPCSAAPRCCARRSRCRPTRPRTPSASCTRSATPGSPRSSSAATPRAGRY